MPSTYTTPNVTYNYIRINGTDIGVSGSCRASFVSPYNKIDFSMTPQNCSLSNYRVMITKSSDEDYDIDHGVLAYSTSNVATGTEKTFSITLSESLFSEFSSENTSYRFSLYAQSALDYSWDVTYLFFTLDDEKFIPSGSSGLEVLTDVRL